MPCNAGARLPTASRPHHAVLATFPSKSHATTSHHDYLELIRFVGEVDVASREKDLASVEGGTRQIPDMVWRSCAQRVVYTRKKCGECFPGWDEDQEGAVVRGGHRDMWQAWDAVYACDVISRLI